MPSKGRIAHAWLPMISWSRSAARLESLTYLVQNPLGLVIDWSAAPRPTNMHTAAVELSSRTFVSLPSLFIHASPQGDPGRKRVWTSREAAATPQGTHRRPAWRPWRGGGAFQAAPRASCQRSASWPRPCSQLSSSPPTRPGPSCKVLPSIPKSFHIFLRMYIKVF